MVFAFFCWIVFANTNIIWVIIFVETVHAKTLCDHWDYQNQRSMKWNLIWTANDIMLCVRASQITSLTIVYSTVYSGAEQRKDKSSASMAFVRGIQRWPVNSRHKGPVTRKMFPFDDVIIQSVPWESPAGKRGLQMNWRIVQNFIAENSS